MCRTLEKGKAHASENVDNLILHYGECAEDGFEDNDTIITEKHTFTAPFVNAEEVQYLVCEDTYDYRFSDKVKYYTGFENNRKQKKEGTKIKELTDLAANATDFTESDIVERNAKIILNFITFMHNNDLLCED